MLHKIRDRYVTHVETPTEPDLRTIAGGDGVLSAADVVMMHIISALHKRRLLSGCITARAAGVPPLRGSRIGA